MVLGGLEAFALAGQEILDYNRANFQFDQTQSIEKDMQRVELQIRRFELFREDIEDLVKLCVDKMDMYHLVAAIFLGFTLTMFTEGRIPDANPDHGFFVTIYCLSIAGAWVYLMLAVWFSMYASVASHSYGVRLRTRHVRLPIPSLAQIQALTKRFTDFEKQGVGDIARVPFGPPGSSSAQPRLAQSRTAEGGLGGGTGAAGASQDLLATGEAGFGREDVVMKQAVAMPQRHVKLFRELQAKWQSYDAYSRVSMALGVNQILQAITYFVIGLAVIEHKMPVTACTLTFVFQMAALAIFTLDVSGVPRHILIVVQVLGGWLPTALVLSLVIYKERFKEDVAPAWWTAGTAVAFILEVMWFALLLKIAEPSDEASLPRNFRAILFLDVFGNAEYDPAGLETNASTGKKQKSRTAQDQQQLNIEVAVAERHLATGQAALRRWEAVPRDVLSPQQRGQVEEARQEYMMRRDAFQALLSEEGVRLGIPYDSENVNKEELRPWNRLSQDERDNEEFAAYLLGPIRRPTQTCYYRLEDDELLEEEPRLQQELILTLDNLKLYIETCRTAVESVQYVRRLVDNEPTNVREDSDRDSDTSGETEETAAAEKRHINRQNHLPWRVLKFVTIMIMVIWFSAGVMEVFQWPCHSVQTGEAKEEEPSGVLHETLHEHEERRRLANTEVPQWPWPSSPFERLAVEWPHGSFFRAEGLACSLGRLWVKSSFFSYSTTGLGSQPVALKALPKAVFPSNAVPMCSEPQGERATPRCFMAYLAAEGRSLELRPFGVKEAAAEAVNATLEVKGRPWQLLSGAVVPCTKVSGLLELPDQDAEEGAPCLLLAGWDGERLPVAAVPLHAARKSGLPTPAQRISSRFEAPLLPSGSPRQKALECDIVVRDHGDSAADTAQSCRAAGTERDQVVALYMESEGSSAGRLWALFRGGDVQAWDLLTASTLGRRRPQWPQAVLPFRATALCVTPADQARRSGTLLVAGVAGMEASPVLLSAALPSAPSATAADGPRQE